MAYTLGLPASVTDLVYSYRDWRFEKVRKANGTPTALAIKDLITIDADEMRVNEAISEGEEIDSEIPEGYANSLSLTSFWWHAALEESHEECQRFHPEFIKELQALQQQREDMMREFYFNHISTSTLLQE